MTARKGETKEEMNARVRLRRATDLEWAEKQRAKKREYSRRTDVRDRNLERSRIWKTNHPEYMRQYHASHRKRPDARRRESAIIRYWSNPDYRTRQAERYRKRRDANPEKMRELGRLASRRQWEKNKNNEEWMAIRKYRLAGYLQRWKTSKEWVDRNRAKHRRYAKESKERLSDSYVRSLLGLRVTRRYSVDIGIFIRAKRAQLLIYRAIKKGRQ